MGQSFWQLIWQRNFIEVRSFITYMDHKPITSAIGRFRHSTQPVSHSSHTPREIRPLAFLSYFLTDIRHVKGSEHQPADALSQIPALTSAASVVPDLTEVSRLQSTDEKLGRHSRSHTSLQLHDVLFAKHVSLVRDTSTGKPRPFLPFTFTSTSF